MGLSYLNEISELYWTVRSFKVNINVLDLNAGVDALGTFLLAGGSVGGVAGATAGLAAVTKQLSTSPLSTINGRTRIFSAYRRKNRKCADSSSGSGSFEYDDYGNIINTNGCQKIKLDKTFLSTDLNTNESMLSVAGPIHSLSSPNGQGYVQVNFEDVIYANRLYWPIIQIFIGNGNVTLTSNILALGEDQNAYNIGGVNFCNMGVITMSGYTISNFQPAFYSVGGDFQVGERCCDRFYFDGANRDENSSSNPCAQNGNNKNCLDDVGYKYPNKQDTANTVAGSPPKEVGGTPVQSYAPFIGGGGDSGGAGASGGW